METEAGDNCKSAQNETEEGHVYADTRSSPKQKNSEDSRFQYKGVSNGRRSLNVTVKSV
jgi:hypothetical protein